MTNLPAMAAFDDSDAGPLGPPPADEPQQTPDPQPVDRPGADTKEQP